MRHRVLREGVIAGLLGATAVAVWFFLVDLLLGQPLHTPLALGRALVTVFGSGPALLPVALIVSYTLFHYAAFVLVGLLASVIVHWAEHEPSVLAGALILFVAIEIAFYAMSSILAQSRAFGAISWLQVAVGNLIAAITMGVYLWRANPALAGELHTALSGIER